MKLKHKLIISVIFVSLITSIILFKKSTPVKVITKPVVTKSLKEINWEKLIGSIMFIESTNNDNAVNMGRCVGCLQISPIYVREVNRISKIKHLNKIYKLSDRYNRKKSIEMFNILQNFRNPKHNFHRAIRLHNPTAGKWYENRIMKYYKNLN